MRFGAFLLGGLAGAAVVMLMRNKTVRAAADDFGHMLRKRVNQVKETAAEKGIYVRFGSGLNKMLRSSDETPLS